MLPKKIPPKIKKFIREWIEYYEKELEMTEYRGDIRYLTEDSKNKEGSFTLMTASVDHRYLSADYCVYPALLRKFKDKFEGPEEVKKVIAHEVGHLATHKLHWMAICCFKDEGETTDAWESLTEKVGRMLYKIGALKKKK